MILKNAIIVVALAMAANLGLGVDDENPNRDPCPKHLDVEASAWRITFQRSLSDEELEDFFRKVESLGIEILCRGRNFVIGATAAQIQAVEAMDLVSSAKRFRRVKHPRPRRSPPF